MEEWTSGRVVAMLAVTSGFLVDARIGHTKPGQKSCTSHLSAFFWIVNLCLSNGTKTIVPSPPCSFT